MTGATYSGTYANGIVLNDPAAQNPATIAEGGYVYNPGGTALYVAAGAAWTISNQGRIGGDFRSKLGQFGVDLTAGGSTLVNSGTIAGNVGVQLAAGDTLIDSGTIFSTGSIAIQMGAADDRLVLDPGAVIRYQIKVHGGFRTGPATVDGGGGTLELAASGTTGTLAAHDFVDLGLVEIDAGASWSGFGVDFSSLVNDGTLSVSGTGTLGSLTNDGILSIAGDAVQLGPVDEATAAGGTIVVAQHGTAELQSTVAVGQTIRFDDHTGVVRLDDPAGFGGAITGFQQGDTIDFAGIVADGLSYGGGVLTLSNGAASVAQLRPSTPCAEPGFALAGDGNGGTLLTVAPQGNPPNLFSGVYKNGIVLGNPATQNPATVTASGYVANTASAGVAIYGGGGFAWTIGNYGTIQQYFGFSFFGGPDIELTAGGTIGNAGAINGGVRYPAITIAGGAGAVANSGAIRNGVTIAGGPGTVANSQTLAGGVYLDAGGSIANAAGAGLSGAVHFISIMTGAFDDGPGVDVGGGAGTVGNLGSIASTWPGSRPTASPSPRRTI